MENSRKLPSDFFENLKDELILPFSVTRFSTIAEDGRYTRRLLARRGDVNTLPFRKVRTHFVSLSGREGKVAIRCGGKVCALCDRVNESSGQFSEERSHVKYLFYELVNSSIKILPMPPGFFKALFGELGRPSEVVKALQNGMNVFDPENGNELVITRQTYEDGVEWHVAIGKKTSLEPVQLEDLREAESLSSLMIHLSEQELVALRDFLDKKTRNLPAKLRR